MKTLKTIIDEHNQSVDFPLFDTTFTVSAERNVYNQLRKKYRDLAYSAESKFAEYDAQFKDLDDLIASAPGALILALEEALNEVSKDAISVGLHTLDPETIMAKCFDETHFEKFTKIYKTYVAVQNKTIENLADAARYRDARKQSRGRWTSMTWGGNVFDAWGNQMKSGAMNITEGIGHSFVNFIGNINDEIDAENNLKEFFKDRGLRNSLIDSVWYCCDNLRRVVTNLVSKQCELNLGGWVTSEDSTKAKAIFNNLAQHSLPLQQQQQFAHEIISLDPYEHKYYVEFLRKFNDSDLQVIAIADFFYISGIREEVKKALVDFVNNNIGTTEEDAYKCKEMLKVKADRLELSNEERQESRKIVEDQLTKLDLEYRTVDGVVLATRDLADLARKELIEIEKIRKSLVPSLSAMKAKSTTPEALLRCEAEIQSCKRQINVFTTDVKNKHLKECDDFLNELDLTYRTVDRVVLETRESADSARKDLVTYKDIFEKPHTDFIFRTDYISHIEKIRPLPVAEPLKAKYVKRYQSHLEDFDKKCKKASYHDHYLKYRNPFWNGNKLVILHYIIFAWIAIGGIRTVMNTFKEEGVGFAIFGALIATAILGGWGYYVFVGRRKGEKKAWEEITRNGKYDLMEIISGKAIVGMLTKRRNEDEQG